MSQETFGSFWRHLLLYNWMGTNWHVVSEGKGFCSTLYNAQESHSQRFIQFPNVNNAELEKLCSKFPYIIQMLKTGVFLFTIETGMFL